MLWNLLQRRAFKTVAYVCGFLGLVAGCSAILSRPVPSSLYQLYYQPQPVACAAVLPASVRIWPLEASPPYDQEALVVLVGDSRVRYSSQYSWVAQPGKMVADWLARDLSGTHLFRSVMTAGEHFADSYDLGGHLFVFAWQGGQDRWQAVLEAEITLVLNHPEQGRKILMRKPYRLVGDSITQNDAEAFASAMSRLVADLSATLQQDLCAVAINGHTAPAQPSRP